MISKRKLALIALNGALVAASITAIGMNTSKAFSVFPETDTASIVWKHYTAVDATYTTHGSKEFWVSCGAGHTIVFNENDVTGTIEEGGDITKTSYWADITEGDNRYVATLVPKVAYDVRGGVEIASSGNDVTYGTKISALPTTTRAGDEYYDGYTFDGWYSDGTKLGDDATVTGDLSLKAGWEYGDAKKVYLEDWTAEKFTKGADVTIKENSFVSGFSADEKGIMFAPGNSDGTDNTMAAPLTNFNELLETRRAIYMYVGGYNGYNKMNVTVSSGDVQLFSNSAQDVKYLKRILLRFAKEGDGKVHMHYSDVTAEKPNDSKAADVTLSDEQAAGTASLVFTAAQYGQTRGYWIGQPYYINGEEKYLDVTLKNGYSVTNAVLKKKDEVSNTKPWGAWTDWVGGLNECIGISGDGTDKTAATLTLEPIDFTKLFDAKKGVRFTIGAWNPSEHVYFGDTDLGVDGAKPDNYTTHTYESLAATWHNWEVSIDDIGAHIYNNNEAKTYDVPLTANQIKGTEGISMKLTTSLFDGRFFLLSNLYTYHI